MLDGFEPGCPLAVNPSGDDDGDGLLNTWEVCRWGSEPGLWDSDGDALGDCLEAADVSGDGFVDFVVDAVYYAKTGLLSPAAFGKDGDFDINGDVIQEAKFGLIVGLCK